MSNKMVKRTKADLFDLRSIFTESKIYTYFFWSSFCVYRTAKVNLIFCAKKETRQTYNKAAKYAALDHNLWLF